MTSRVLVTGGAGYVGSHIVVQLAAAGYQPVVVDDFRNAKRDVIPRLEGLTGGPIEVHVFDLTDRDRTDALFAADPIHAVIHCAGLKAVAESVAEPLAYYANNLDCTFSVVRAMHAHGVRQLVFSSSATVYGGDAEAPMSEDLPTSAINPYGWTKVMIEQVLRDVAVTDPDWRIALLRYFNPAGAHPSGQIGEDPNGIPNNLMPIVAQVATGRRDQLMIFGNDYPTPDGTAQRDYIHVDDLATGHVAALARLAEVQDHVSTWNLGTGEPTSVMSVIKAFEQACGRTLRYEVVDRRPGDAAVSFADPTRAEAELGWKATQGIDEICRDSWRWQSGNPHGYS